MEAVFDTVETGVDAYDAANADEGAGDDTGESADESATHRIQSALGVSAADILDRVGRPLFVTDAAGSAVVWNSSIEQLTGVSAAEAREKELLSQAFYHDDHRAQTLADKVLDAPRNADTEYGADRVAGVGDTCIRTRA